MQKIYLASGSPRRKELMTQLIWEKFEIITSEYEEDNTLDMFPPDLALLHAQEKCKDVISKLDSGIVISADTLVFFQDKVLWKPMKNEVAKEYLRMISWNYLEVVTGFAVGDASTSNIISAYEISKVKIKNLSDQEIDSYVATGEPLDKAGAFAIQWKWAIFVEKIEGCYFNIVWLPLFRLSEKLKQIGVSVL